jgi:hypothetical protein
MCLMCCGCAPCLLCQEINHIKARELAGGMVGAGAVVMLAPGQAIMDGPKMYR